MILIFTVCAIFARHRTGSCPSKIKDRNFALLASSPVRREARNETIIKLVLYIKIPRDLLFSGGRSWCGGYARVRDQIWVTPLVKINNPTFKNVQLLASRDAGTGMLVPGKFQIRTSKNVHLIFSWYRFKTEDVYKTFTGPCFKICTTKILNGPGKQF